MFIAAPTLLLTLLSPLRVNLTIFALTISYLFYEWFYLHPLRVGLMGGVISYLYISLIKNISILRVRILEFNMDRKSPSLYEILTGNFTGDLSLDVVNEEDQVILSVLDNIQRILNARAGTVSHLPDYGLPDMTKILQGMPGTAHELMGTLSAVLLKYEPRLQKIDVILLEQDIPGELRYAIDAELKGIGLVRYGTEFMPEGRVLIRHLKQQQYLEVRSSL